MVLGDITNLTRPKSPVLELFDASKKEISQPDFSPKFTPNSKSGCRDLQAEFAATLATLPALNTSPVAFFSMGSSFLRTCSVPVLSQCELPDGTPRSQMGSVCCRSPCASFEQRVGRPSLEPRTRSEGPGRRSSCGGGVSRRCSLIGMLPEERLKALGGEAQRRLRPKPQRPSLGPPLRSLSARGTRLGSQTQAEETIFEETEVTRSKSQRPFAPLEATRSLISVESSGRARSQKALPAHDRQRPAPSAAQRGARTPQRSFRSEAAEESMFESRRPATARSVVGARGAQARGAAPARWRF